ncbi:hypothetical protein PN36_11065 [Candidatus Thiomargarita nelsonii]|uniref:Uncharacterized protein n=1 Tax=Candidatus Thiomargarita nelsonii TaxID=1003181 RepID=A0A0A6RYV1_9GAMM|nr:hypothetical protein PN36_11065 [Candidatus Thiomargarita nelsonii]
MVQYLAEKKVHRGKSWSIAKTFASDEPESIEFINHAINNFFKKTFKSKIKCRSGDFQGD